MLTRRTLFCISFALFVPLSGCFRASSGRSSASGDRSILSGEEVREGRFTSAFDVVDALRRDWLQMRGTNSFTHPTEIQVYLDGARLGTVASLREIPATSVAQIQHFNGMDATARWGLDHGQGVIYVTSTAGRRP